MCDCDCELPKRERWAQIRAEAMQSLTTVPNRGRFVVYDGTVYRIVDMWREQGPASDGREKWGVVMKKESNAQADH